MIIVNHAKIPVVIGGIHVSTSSNDVINYIKKYCPFPDLVSQVIGAGDFQVLESVLADLDTGTQKSDYYGYKMIDDGTWKVRPNVELMPQMRIQFLKRLPIIGKFISHAIRIIPVSPFLGCPYSCNFCSISTLPKNQRKLSVRSTTDFLDELEDHSSKGGLRNSMYFFLPDNLLLAKKYVREVMKGIVDRNLRVNFATQISIDVADDEELLSLMREAGATHFFIGFESLDIRNLNYIGKHILKNLKKEGMTVEEYYEKRIRKIQEYGISIHGAFIFGLPYDYFASFECHTGYHIANFCIKNHIGLQPCSLTDLPGSMTFQESQDHGTWLYGKQGSSQYLIGLCLTDLTEMNKIPSEKVGKSPLQVFKMAWDAIQKAGSTSIAFKNALLMAYRSFRSPTARGKYSLRERFIDAFFSFASQIVVSLYKDHGDSIAYSRNGITGTYERLFTNEKNPAIRKSFTRYIRQFLSVKSYHND